MYNLGTNSGNFKNQLAHQILDPPISEALTPKSEICPGSNPGGAIAVLNLPVFPRDFLRLNSVRILGGLLTLI